MQLFKNQLTLFTLSLFIFSNASAITIDINLEAAGYTSSLTQFESSFTFGDYIFETENGTSGLTLTDQAEGVLIDNASSGGDFRLSRTDLGFFNLLSIVHAGLGTTTIGATANNSGVDVIHFDEVSATDTSNYRNYLFIAGEPGITNVNSILFSPDDLIQLSSFQVEAVPVPASIWLFGSGLLGLVGVARRKKA